MQTQDPRQTQRRRFSVCFGASALFLLLLTPPALAQGGKKPPPPDRSDVSRERQEVSPDLIKTFQRAYEDDQRPVMLVLIGMDGRTSNDGQGQAGRVPGVGANLMLFDASGLTEQMGAGVGGWLLKNRSLDLVDMESLSDLERREAEVLSGNNEDAAVDMLCNRLNADLVFYIKLQRVPANLQQGEDVPYKMIYQIKDIKRGRKVDEDAINYRGSTDIHRTREYAASLATWFMEQYIDYVNNRPRGRRFTVRFLGFEGDRQMNQARRAMGDIELIDGRIAAEYTSRGADSYGEMRLRYDGDALDLSYDIQELLEEDMNLRFTGLDNQGGIIMLRIGSPKPPPPPPTWVEIRDAAPTFQVDFKSQYIKKGRPKIGIVINWLVRPDQMSAQVQGTMPLVVMQGDARLGATPQGPDVIGLNAMEGMIGNVFREAGVTGVVDPDQVRTVLEKQADKISLLHGAEDVSTLLRAQDGFDIIVYGLANVTRDNQTNAERIRYSFKIKDLNNGEFLGSQQWPDQEHREFGVDVRDPEQVGRYIASRLLADIYNNSLRECSTLDVTVHDARSIRDVSRLCETFQNNVVDVHATLNPTFDNGTGRFTVRYSGDYKALIDEVGTLMDAQPFEIENANRGSLALRQKKLPHGEVDG